MGAEGSEITLLVGGEDGRWYAVACHGKRLVATAAGSDRREAEAAILQCIPAGRTCVPAAEGDAYPEAVLRMLARLEAGGSEAPVFELCPDCVSDALAAILRTSAAIPVGYASTYGDVAAAAGSVARAVGRVMATNPLYPIVACHRVVGADLSLVGYGGRQDGKALRAKRDRLRAEAKGFREERTIPEAGGLRVVPVEWVLARASHDGLDAVQLPLF